MRMVVPEVRAEKICLAKNQPEYKVLTVALVNHPEYGVEDGRLCNSLLMAFRPTDEERQRIMLGEDIYISLFTAGGPMQPILVLCGRHEAAATFGVEVES